MTHICVSKLTSIGSDNGLSPDRHQAIIWTNAGIMLIGPLGTNFIEILIEILTFSFKKMRMKVSSAKRQPFCLGLNVLKYFIKYLQKTPHNSPVKASYGVPFVSSKSDLYSSLVPGVLYAISCHIVPCYNGPWWYTSLTRLPYFLFLSDLADL